MKEAIKRLETMTRKAGLIVHFEIHPKGHILALVNGFDNLILDPAMIEKMAERKSYKGFENTARRCYLDLWFVRI